MKSSKLLQIWVKETKEIKFVVGRRSQLVTTMVAVETAGGRKWKTGAPGKTGSQATHYDGSRKGLGTSRLELSITLNDSNRGFSECCRFSTAACRRRSSLRHVSVRRSIRTALKLVISMYTNNDEATRATGVLGRGGGETRRNFEFVSPRLIISANRIRLERAPQKQSSDAHKTPYDRVKRFRERRINVKKSECVNVSTYRIVELSWENWAALKNEDLRADEAPECRGETGDARENPPTSGIARNDSHLRKYGVTRPGSNLFALVGVKQSKLLSDRGPRHRILVVIASEVCRGPVGRTLADGVLLQLTASSGGSGSRCHLLSNQSQGSLTASHELAVGTPGELHKGLVGEALSFGEGEISEDGAVADLTRRLIGQWRCHVPHTQKPGTSTVTVRLVTSQRILSRRSDTTSDNEFNRQVSAGDIASGSPRAKSEATRRSSRRAGYKYAAVIQGKHARLSRVVDDRSADRGAHVRSRTSPSPGGKLVYNCREDAITPQGIHTKPPRTTHLTPWTTCNPPGKLQGVLLPRPGISERPHDSSAPQVRYLFAARAPVFLIARPEYGTAPEWGDGEAGDPREGPLTSGIVRHDSHMREFGLTVPGIEPGSPWLEIGRLTAQPPWPPDVKLGEGERELMESDSRTLGHERYYMGPQAVFNISLCALSNPHLASDVRRYCYRLFTVKSAHFTMNSLYALQLTGCEFPLRARFVSVGYNQPLLSLAHRDALFSTLPPLPHPPGEARE
ncbi:hypothetical protein PR048_006089 [Dryococelus australis]|uniref:Uncharacterized protein n=1 Tax=Dryococelus australis TaxID=614101 RepID=A0ABQ9IA35_9NEOP|nr:hypothetical protein PR048_006089 [Dryococelus australis]